MRRFVLDANALLHLLENGSDAGKIRRLLQDASSQSEPLLVSVANWGEVFYVSWQRTGEERARATLAQLLRLPINVVSVDIPQVLKAGEIKALYHIPYVDCLAATLAMLSDATLVTSDRDFEKLGRQFPVMWLSRR